MSSAAQRTLHRVILGPPVSFHTTLADLCVLQNYMAEMFDLQLVESQLRDNPATLALVTELHRLLRDQSRSLATALKKLAGHGDEIRKSAAAMAGSFVGFLTKFRARDLSAMLRNDFSMLRLVGKSYRRLQAAALVSHHRAVAKLSLTHRKRITTLTRSLAKKAAAIMGTIFLGRNSSASKLKPV